MRLFADADHKEISRASVGGKAAGLAHLTRAGINVPIWFVLTTDCFEAFLGENLPEYVEILENYKAEDREKLASLIENTEFCDELRASIRAEITRRFNTGDRLAVRSSAVDEDSNSHSFAGMMDSFLDVPADDSLLECIKKCYLSAFSERIMKYREQNGLIAPSIRVAVVIQKMIDADHAGVIFTSDPQTNDPDEVLISVVGGTGEKLVSGESNSSDYILDFEGNIVARSESDGVSLSDEILKELHEGALTIEKSFSPRIAQDIEFCIKDGEIYFLQSRAITTHSHIDKNKTRVILDNSNIIESYSGVTTPLTYSFAREVYAKVYNQTLKHFYIKQEAIDEIQDDLQHMLLFYENKIYYRLNSWYRMTSLYPGYETNKKYMENMMGVKVALKESKRQAKLRQLRIYLHCISAMLRIKKDSDRFRENFETITSPYYRKDFEGASNAELLEIYDTIEAQILDKFTVPITNDMATMVVYGILCDWVKKLPVDNPEGVISDILGKQGQVESVGQTLDLFKTVNKIKNDTELSSLFLSGDHSAIWAELDRREELATELDEYICRYGARTMDELKLETETMLERPEQLFDMIAQYLAIDTDLSVYRESYGEESKSKEDALYSACSAFKRPLMRLLVRITKFFVRNRESLRLRRTYIYSIVRKIFLRMGANLEEMGVLERGRDVFYLKKDELFRYDKDGCEDIAALRATVLARKAEMEENREKPVNERMYFYGEMRPENMIPIYSRQEAARGKSDLLSGVAGGGGVAVGRVKYVEDPTDADVKGRILMAKRTDPGWTVLFPMADAIIIERGSVLSHSAVVAREMGLTLVVGIRGLTDVIKDGMLVRVDGINGTVEILGEGEEN